MSNLQESNVLLSVWGDDFRFDELEEWYQQYDNLMPLFDYINNYSKKTRVRFGTFTDYFNALEQNNKKKNLSPATLSGDFFPYQCAAYDYWTGYYTTRPFYKKQERELHLFIRSADLLSTSALMYLSMKNRLIIGQDLTEARRNLALFQHHDAITGTSKNHVMKDYSERMFASLKIAEDVLRIALSSLLRSNDFEIDNIPLMYNESSSKKLIVVDQPKTILVYNSESYARMEPIELLVSRPDVIVTGADGPIHAQIEPYFDSITGEFTKNYLLVFFARLKPLSFTQHAIQRGRSKTTETAHIISVAQPIRTAKLISKHFIIEIVKKKDFVLHTPQLTAELDHKTGLLQAVLLNDANGTQRLKCAQSYDYYYSTFSGAYVMRLQRPQVKKLQMTGVERFIVFGSLRQIAYTLSTVVKQRLSVNNVPKAEGSHLHMQLHIDARNISKAELITRFATDLVPESTQFYTDSIGLQLIKRAEYEKADRQEMNYYPMPTALVLEDEMKRLSILSNVPHGARTLGKTGFEIMLDRRLEFDDGKGLGAFDDGIPVDNIPVNMAFKFVLEKMASTDDQFSLYAFDDPSKLQLQQRRFAYNTLGAHLALHSLIYQPNIFIVQGIPKKWPLQRVLPFPCDVQLLTVRPLSDVNLRLMILHRAGIDCSSLSAPTCLASELDDAVKSYLLSIGASTVQKTLLNGVEKIGKEMDYRNDSFYLEPMDFVAYLIRFG